MRVPCPGCNTKASEWEEDPDAYIAEHYCCPGCQRLEEEKGNVDDDAKGIHFRLLPRAVMERKMALEDAEAAERAQRLASEENQ